MKVASCIGLAAIVMIAAGCSKSNAEPASDGSGTSYTVNGQTPDDYFKQFIAKQIGQCPDQLRQRFLSASSMLVGKNDKGQDIRANVAIYMHEDQTYVANFEEDDVFEYPADCQADLCYNYRDIRKKQLKGSWQVVNDHLVLSDLATGMAINYNGNPAVELQFTNDIITAGLKGQMFAAHNARNDLDENSEYVCK